MLHENAKMSTDYTIAHHWVPLELFYRLGELHPNGNYNAITRGTVVFEIVSENMTENWFLHCDFLC